MCAFGTQYHDVDGGCPAPLERYSSILAIMDGKQRFCTTSVIINEHIGLYESVGHLECLKCRARVPVYSDRLDISGNRTIKCQSDLPAEET